MEPKPGMNPKTVLLALYLLIGVGMIVGFVGLFNASDGGTKNPFPVKSESGVLAYDSAKPHEHHTEYKKDSLYIANGSYSDYSVPAIDTGEYIIPKKNFRVNPKSNYQDAKEGPKLDTGGTNYDFNKEYYSHVLDSLSYVKFRVLRKLTKLASTKENRRLTVAEMDTVRKLQTLSTLLDVEDRKFRTILEDL